jgi:hypothetical protein
MGGAVSQIRNRATSFLAPETGVRFVIFAEFALYFWYINQVIKIVYHFHRFYGAIHI